MLNYASGDSLVYAKFTPNTYKLLINKVVRPHPWHHLINKLRELSAVPTGDIGQTRLERNSDILKTVILASKDYLFDQ